MDASVLLASEDPDDAHHSAATDLLVASDPLATLDLAYYEVTNVAIRAWHDSGAADRLRDRVVALSGDAGIVRVDPALLSDAAAIAAEQGISVYDAAYVAASRFIGAPLVSCDVRDLVSRSLARLPGDALAESTSAQPPSH